MKIEDINWEEVQLLMDKKLFYHIADKINRNLFVLNLKYQLQKYLIHYK